MLTANCLRFAAPKIARLDSDDLPIGFGRYEQEFFHSLARVDGDFDALEKRLEQAHHSGNREWA